MQESPFAIRLTADDIEAIEVIADHTGATKAGAIRYALRETVRTIKLERRRERKADKQQD